MWFSQPPPHLCLQQECNLPHLQGLIIRRTRLYRLLELNLVLGIKGFRDMCKRTFIPSLETGHMLLSLEPVTANMATTWMSIQYVEQTTGLSKGSGADRQPQN